MTAHHLSHVPWDSTLFGRPAWMVTSYTEAALQQAVNTPGHHSLWVDPLADKKMLHDFGFYYCDTLIEPWCTADRLKPARNFRATISETFEPEEVLRISDGAFVHGRMHRDFGLPNDVADKRYVNWLASLMQAQTFGLYWDGMCAGFVACEESKLVLHAVSSDFRGQGLAKFWWSEVCLCLLEKSFAEIISSVSASNVAVVNLYASLGFKFRNPRDAYHRIVD